jgi:hypothetical protein
MFEFDSSLKKIGRLFTGALYSIVFLFTQLGCPIIIENEDSCNSDSDCGNNELCQRGVCQAIAGFPQPGRTDGGASTEDGGSQDDGDAGTPVLPDAGIPVQDAGTPDAGTPDAGTPDAGTPDAGTPDAGTPDAGTPDAGTPVEDGGGQDGGGQDGGDIGDGGAFIYDSGLAEDAGQQTPDAGTPQPCATIDPNGLQAYYSFDQLQGHVLLDTSGNGRNGTIEGATWTDGQSCGALEFDGTDDYVDLSPVSGEIFPAGTTNLTVALWFYPLSLNLGDFNRLLSKSSGTDSSEHDLMLSFDTSDSHLVVRSRLKVDGTTHTLVGHPGYPLSTDTWFHVAMTYDGTDIILYHNGIVVAQTRAEGALSDTTSLTNLGRNPDATNLYHGKLDELAVYHSTLSHEEIFELMDATGREPTDADEPTWPLEGGENCHPAHADGLMAQYGFDELDGPLAINDANQEGAGSGVLFHAKRTEGQFCGGMQFDSADAHVDLTSLHHLTNLPEQQLTVSLWFRPDDLLGHKWSRLFSNEDGVNTTNSSVLLSTAPRNQVSANNDILLRGRIRIGSSNLVLLSEGPFLENYRWTHAALTYDGEMVRLYQDGVEVAQAPKTGSIRWRDDTRILLGNTPTSSGSSLEPDAFAFNGTMDDVVIYDRALSQLEVLEIRGEGLQPIEHPQLPCEIDSYNGHTYAACLNEQVQLNARQTCLNAGMDLVVVNDLSENAFLSSWAESIADAETLFYIGLARENEFGAFYWMDGSSFNFSAWTGQEPNNTAGIQNCVSFEQGGLWSDRNCNNYFSFFCESLDSPLSIPLQSRDLEAESSCELYQNSTDLYVACPPTSQLSAAASCQWWGGNLPSPTSDDDFMELEEVGNAITASTSIDMSTPWLGALDIYDTNEWQWTDGESWMSNIWEDEPGEANNLKCAISNEGDWAAEANCDALHPFFCLIPDLPICEDPDQDGWGEGCFQDSDCAPNDPQLNQVCAPEVNLCDGLFFPETWSSTDAGPSVLCEGNSDCPENSICQNGICMVNTESEICNCQMVAGESLTPDYLCLTPLDWFSARQACAIMGRGLVDITVESTNNELLDELSILDGGTAWFGLVSDKSSAYGFNWESEQDWTESSYGSNFITDVETGCVFLTQPVIPDAGSSTSPWVVDDCSTPRPFICEDL